MKQPSQFSAMRGSDALFPNDFGKDLFDSGNANHTERNGNRSADVDVT